MSYIVNEGILPLPGNWQDQSMNVLMPVLSDIQGTNLVLTRDILPAGSVFPDYLSTQRKKFRQELPDFTLSLQQSCQIDGREAEYMEFNWKNQDVTVYQLALVIQNNSQVISLTYTSPKQMPDDNRNQMRNTLHQFRFTQSSERHSAH